MNKPILLTSANSSIGLSIAENLLRSGRRFLFCHYHEKNTEIFELLKKYDLNPNDHCCDGDLSSESEVHRLADQFFKKLDGIWSVINTAGVSHDSITWKMPLELFNNTLSVNLTSQFLLAKTFIPHMRKSQLNGGRFISFSSVVASIGVPGTSAYAAAKAGLEGFNITLAKEIAQFGITSNVIALGYFDGGMIKQLSQNNIDDVLAKTPCKRLGIGMDVAGLVDYLLDEKSGFLSGQTLHLNGAYY